MAVRVAEKCVYYCGDAGESGYVMCNRGSGREIKAFRLICESTCPYYKEKQQK